MSGQINEGYLMIDHRASPGLPNDHRFGIGTLGEGTLFEVKTNHCNHCGVVVVMNPLRTRDRAYCSRCNHYVCDNCGTNMRLPDYNHRTYKQYIDDIYDIGAKIGAS